MKVTLLSANLWLLPPPASVDNQIRLESFVDLTMKLDPDIVNLQEVWLNRYRKFLKKSFKGKYYSVYPRSLVYNKSGLMTLVKHKPKKVRFKSFDKDNISAVEKVATKGILYTKFEKSGKEFIVINTHLHETREKAKLEIAASQTKKILHWAKKHNPTIISGDFNLEKKVVQEILEGFKFEENIDDTYSTKNKYARSGAEFFRNKQGVHLNRPDHVLANIKHKEAKIESKVLQNVFLSDHFPIWAEINVPDEQTKKTKGFFRRAFGV